MQRELEVVGAPGYAEQARKTAELSRTDPLLVVENFEMEILQGLNSD